MSILGIRKDVIEIFGFAADDTSSIALHYRNNKLCPFISTTCRKCKPGLKNHRGACSVTGVLEEEAAENDGFEKASQNKVRGNVIVCPNRLYADNYETLKCVSHDAFGPAIPFIMYSSFQQNPCQYEECVVAVGENAGSEVVVGELRMDWVLVHLRDTHVVSYVGVEVQSIDITGSYGKNYDGYLKKVEDPNYTIPSSKHGLNWANVYKRLIPQLIRKGNVYSRSEKVNKGLYFIVPEYVFERFLDIVGELEDPGPGKDSITVLTYQLGAKATPGSHRELLKGKVPMHRFKIKDFMDNFFDGPNLPKSLELDKQIQSRVRKGLAKSIQSNLFDLFE